jgi:alkylation response protein AidB-like acyl-CoA dehydrogenase
MNDDTQAEMQHWQARCDEMQVSIERLRESRDEARAETERARASCDLLMAEIARLEHYTSEQGARIDRLTLHLQQGIEL